MNAKIKTKKGAPSQMMWRTPMFVCDFVPLHRFVPHRILGWLHHQAAPRLPREFFGSFRVARCREVVQGFEVHQWGQQRWTYSFGEVTASETWRCRRCPKLLFFLFRFLCPGIFFFLFFFLKAFQASFEILVLRKLIVTKTLQYARTFHFDSPAIKLSNELTSGDASVDFQGAPTTSTFNLFQPWLSLLSVLITPGRWSITVYHGIPPISSYMLELSSSLNIGQMNPMQPTLSIFCRSCPLIYT